MCLRLLLWVIFYVFSLLAVTSSQQKFLLNATFSLVDQQLSFLTKYSEPEVVFNLPSRITFVLWREKYLKRRFLYGNNHPGSYNPAVISNQAMVNGNMNQQCSTENQKTKKSNTRGSKGTVQITNFFPKVAETRPGKLPLITIHLINTFSRSILKLQK